MKSVQIRSYFWYVFSFIRIEYGDLFNPSTGKYGPEITPYLDTFHAVILILRFLTFKKNILQFIRPTANSVYNCHNAKGIKLITRLRLGLSNLSEHKFKHNFQESLNPLCNCGHGIEAATHFFLHCPLFTNARYTLLSTLSSIDYNLLNNTHFVLTQALLFGNLSYSNKNLEILNATIDYILSTKRFDEALF